jgi:two-component system CheB/CheR fusion protein
VPCADAPRRGAAKKKKRRTRRQEVDRVDELEKELQHNRESLQSMVEELEASNEEMKSTNEELQSTNEELQSTNEELETSKEELQSTNEELTTTNEELRNRNRDLGVLNVQLEDARLKSELAQSYADIIIETVRSPLAVIDSEFRIRRANRAFLSDMHVPAEKLERLLIDAEDDGTWNVPLLRKRLSAVIRDGEPIDDWEVTLDVPERGRRMVTLTARRIPADGGRQNLVLLAVDDVTDRAAIAADLLANSQRKDEFLAMLSHELRHPLTPITHAIHLLRSTATDPVTADLYETIETQTRRLGRFVNELLDIVRINRNLLAIAHDRVDLVEVARATVAAMRPSVREYRHALTVTTGDEPIIVDGDAGRLDQVITNLLENSIKFTPPGGQITLTLAQHENEALLSVRDNGVGIPPDRLGRIFEPFAQAEGALTRRGGGLGLGLTVVRYVTQLHGGRVEARSRGRGEGSEFLVWLPTARRKAKGAKRPVSTPSVTAPARRRKVLVVDDREEVTLALSRLIGAFGHEVAVAEDATTAMKVAASFKPDSAILDLGLPDASGYDLARRLRESAPDRELFLIAYTGHGNADVRDQCLDAGFDECLIKPGDPVVLEQLLGNVPVDRERDKEVVRDRKKSRREEGESRDGAG